MLATQPTRGLGSRSARSTRRSASISTRSSSSRKAAARSRADGGLRGGRARVPREAQAGLHGTLTCQLERTTIGRRRRGRDGRGIAQVAAAARTPRGARRRARPGAARARAGVDREGAWRARWRRASSTRSDAMHVSRASQFSGARARRTIARRSRGCGLVIEAIVESSTSSRRCSRALEAVVRDRRDARDEHLVALRSRRSRRACRTPERVLGMHFFNPAPVMPLVEIVPWLGTESDVAAAARALVRRVGEDAPCSPPDTPGFIVNRVARPFYGEALRILDEGIADVATIDWAMQDARRVPHGPVRADGLHRPRRELRGHAVGVRGVVLRPALPPSLTQQRLVEAGFLGRKTGRGFYDYRRRRRAARAGERRRARRSAIFDRMLAMLVNEAVDAVFMRVASAGGHRSRDDEGRELPEGPARVGRRDRPDRGPRAARGAADRVRRRPLSAESAAATDGGEQRRFFV